VTLVDSLAGGFLVMLGGCTPPSRLGGVGGVGKRR
jgi:hypothetical protein